MISYTTNELIPSSEFAKKFGSYLSQITNNVVGKLAILRNNKVEAILISKDEFERMQYALELYEHQETYNIIQERVSKPYKTLSHEQLLADLDINPDELVHQEG